MPLNRDGLTMHSINVLGVGYVGHVDTILWAKPADERIGNLFQFPGSLLFEVR